MNKSKFSEASQCEIQKKKIESEYWPFGGMNQS